MTDAYAAVQDNKIPLRLVTLQPSSTYRPYFGDPQGCDFSDLRALSRYSFLNTLLFGKLVASDKITWGT